MTDLCSAAMTLTVRSGVVEVGMEISQSWAILISLTVSPPLPMMAPARRVGMRMRQTILSSSLGSSYCFCMPKRLLGEGV